MTEIVIVVEGGRVTDVHASERGMVVVNVIDRDTHDPDEMDAIGEKTGERNPQQRVGL